METYINDDHRTDLYNNADYDDAVKTASAHQRRWIEAGFKSKMYFADDTQSILVLETW